MTNYQALALGKHLQRIGLCHVQLGSDDEGNLTCYTKIGPNLAATGIRFDPLGIAYDYEMIDWDGKMSDDN